MTCDVEHLTGDYSTVKFWEDGRNQGQYGQPRLKMAINPVDYYETDQIQR